MPKLKTIRIAALIISTTVEEVARMTLNGRPICPSRSDENGTRTCDNTCGNCTEPDTTDRSAGAR